MGFRCGLVGLPNAGKSTIFNAMTNLGVEASAYPFCTIDPHTGIIQLEDSRLDTIHQIMGSAKKTSTVLEFVDIAGLVKGAHQGEGLGNQFLSHIGGVDAIAHVVRCFEDKNVSHPANKLDPVDDAKTVTLELILKDMDLVERRLQKARSSAKSGDPKMLKQITLLEPILEHLSKENEIRSLTLSDAQNELVREMNCLTAKPVIFIANVDENHLQNSPLVGTLEKHAENMQAPCLPFCGKVQAEIAELDQNDQLEFLKAMGLTETALQKILKTGYGVLKLITFFTANQNEAHAWTIPQNTAVIKAAAKVHTDFETNFIKAEVVHYNDLELHSSMKTLHDKGLVLIHGRDYIVQDGDLILFKIR